MANEIVTTEQIESQLVELRTQPQPSRELVDRLNELADHYLRETDAKRVLALSQEAYDLAARLEYPAGRARSLNQLAIANERSGKRALALTQALEGLAIAQESANQQSEIDLRLTIMMATNRMGLFDQSVTHGLTAIPLCRKLGNHLSEATILTRLGIAYSSLGDLDRALGVEQQALAIRRRHHDLPGIAISLNNLTYLHILRGEDEQARNFVDQCLKACQELEQQGQPVSTYGYLLTNMVDLCVRAGDLDKALEHLQEGVKFNHHPYGTPRLSDLEAFLLRDLGRVYRLRRNYDKAEATLEAAAAYCTRTNDNDSLAAVRRELSQLYEQHGHFPQALQQLKAAYQIHKQMRNEQSTLKIRTLQTLYETEQARRDASAYLDKNQQQKELIAKLEHTKQQLQKALADVQRRTVEQERLLAENTQLRTTIHKISIPVLPLTEGILVAPLIGTLDSKRLQHFQTEILNAIQHSAAALVLLDITAVPLVDSQIAQGLLSTVQAAKLLGSDVVLVGIRPEVAQAIVGLGIDLQKIRTTANLQSALARIGILQAMQ